MTERATILSVESHSSPGTWYRVWVGENGPIFCECPAHKFKRGAPSGQRPPCKHMKALAAGTVAGSDAATAARFMAQIADDLNTLPESDETVASGLMNQLRQSIEGKNKIGRIRVIEVQQRANENSAWVSVGNLERFNQLEV